MCLHTAANACGIDSLPWGGSLSPKRVQSTKHRAWRISTGSLIKAMLQSMPHWLILYLHRHSVYNLGTRASHSYISIYMLLELLMKIQIWTILSVPDMCYQRGSTSMVLPLWALGAFLLLEL